MGVDAEHMARRVSYRKCQALVSTLTLPNPFSVDALVTILAEQRGRPIHVHTLPAGCTVNACGLWVRTDSHDDIYVEENTTRFHRDHIILHEIGHMLCGHADNNDTATPKPGDHQELARFLPDLDPGLIERLLARTGYTTDEEQEAELVASLIRTTAQGQYPTRSPGVLGELEAALGIRDERR